jgi:hypothetical protein
MRQTNPAEVSSYAGSIVAVLSSLTLNDIGVILGIIFGVATFVLNAVFMRRKDRRESEEHAARLRALGMPSHE